MQYGCNIFQELSTLLQWNFSVGEFVHICIDLFCILYYLAYLVLARLVPLAVDVAFRAGVIPLRILFNHIHFFLYCHEINVSDHMSL